MPNDTRDMLEKLIETCRDGETGYLHAASVAEDSELKGYFQQRVISSAEVIFEFEPCSMKHSRIATTGIRVGLS